MKKLVLNLNRIFLILSIVYISTTIFLFLICGPVETEIFGFKFSLISLDNPIRISLGLYLLSLIFKVLGTQQPWPALLKKLWLLIQTGGVSADPCLVVPLASNPRLGRWVESLGLVSAFWAIFFFVRLFSADVAGFSDCYGYISEAVRLSQGRLYEPEHVYSLFGLPEDARSSHPLGYIEKGSQGTVPTYPFGYPLIMAAFIKLFGLQGAYWVTPLLAAGTVLLTYWLGRVYLGRLGGVIAAGFLLFFPNFLFSTFLPMSDVPATFFTAFTLVALLALRPSPFADLLLGASLGFGIWVRPNMVLLILPVVVWFVIRKEWLRLLRVFAAILPFILVNALVNGYLYGSLWKTGYGNPPIGGSFFNMLERGNRHLMRLHDQQAGIGLFLLIFSLLLGRLSLARRLLFTGIFAVFLGFFAAYQWDDAWWYFRFILPAMPAVAVLEASLFFHFISTGQWRRWRGIFLTIGFIIFAWASINYANTNFVFDIKNGQTKYVRAAAMVSNHVTKPALILAMEHSGSLRFYADLPTTRYDLTPGPELLDKIRAVNKAGGHVYLLVEKREFQKFADNNLFVLLSYSRLVDIILEPEKVWLFKLDVPSF